MFGTKIYPINKQEEKNTLIFQEVEKAVVFVHKEVYKEYFWSL